MRVNAYLLIQIHVIDFRVWKALGVLILSLISALLIISFFFSCVFIINCFYIQTDIYFECGVHFLKNALTYLPQFFISLIKSNIELELIMQLDSTYEIELCVFDCSVYKHVCIVFFVRHSLHLTSQHQWNVQEQRSTTITSCVRYPRPQHIKSHPSTPIDVSLHWRPLVPWIPHRGFFTQNPGDGSKYTKSLPPGALWSGMYGFNWKWYLNRDTHTKETMKKGEKVSGFHWKTFIKSHLNRSLEEKCEYLSKGFQLNLLKLPVIFSSMIIPSNGIRWYAVRARGDIIWWYIIAMLMCNRIFTCSIRTVANHHTWCSIEAIL